MRDLHLLNEQARELSVAVDLFNAQRQLMQADRDAKVARREMLDNAVDELARRRWLEALGRREFALETIEQLEQIIGLSDAIAAELPKP